jgi:hypothetical protein
MRHAITKFLRHSVAILLLLGASGVARAEDWTHAGNTWHHATGISMEIPSTFRVLEHNRILTLTSARGGAFEADVVWAHGKVALDETIAYIGREFQGRNVTMNGGLRQRLGSEAYTVGPAHLGGTGFPQPVTQQRTVELAAQDGTAVLNGANWRVHLVVLAHDEDYLVCRMYIPAQLYHDFYPSLYSLFSSVAYSFPEAHL